MTNYEYIKTLGLNELAEFIASVIPCEYCNHKTIADCKDSKHRTCAGGFEKWLKAERSDKSESL